MTTIAELLVKIGVSVDGAKQAEKDVDGTTEAAEGTDKKGSPKLKAFAKVAKVAFGAVAVAAVAATGAIAAAGGAIFSFVNDQTAALDKIAKASKQTGLGAQEYQRLAFAAERSGSSIDVVGKAAKKVGVQLMDVAMGGGKNFTAALDQIGLSVADIEGKSAEEQLGIIGDAMNANATAAEKATIAARLFGEEAGPSLVPLLNEGAAGLAKLGEAAGDVFTDDELASAEAFQDSITNVKRLLGQVTGELAVALTPAIEAGVEVFRKFIAENDELIKQQLPRIFKMVAENATKMLPIALDVVSVVADLVEEAEPLIDRFLVFTSGQLEKGLSGTKSAIELLLPLVIKLAGAVLDVVEGIEKAYNWSQTLLSIEKNQSARGQGAKFASGREDIVTTRERRKQEADDAQKQWDENAKAAREAHEKQSKITQLARLKRATDGGRTWDAESARLAESFGVTRDDVRKFSGTPIPRRGGGGRSSTTPAKEPPKEARFGDFRDVLQVYMGRSPEEAAQGLATLAAGTMPADHRPETSINITNNITNTYDIKIPVSGAGSAPETADAVRDVLMAEFKSVAAKTQQNIAR